MHAALRLANGDVVTQRFGRTSPALARSQQKAEIQLKVSKDRNKVTANVGHRVLSHFVSGEVQATKCDVERQRHSWTVQAGPFAEHTVQIVKQHALGKIVTLLVDGTILVEALAADIGCQGKDWQCKFQLAGERVLDFEVFKTNKEGSPLDITDHVKERRRYKHECVVVLSNDWDFGTARLFVDGTPFNELPLKPEHHEDPTLTMDPRAMLHSYGIATPYKVDPHAPTNISVLANQVFLKACDTKKAAGGFFASCCDCNSVVNDDSRLVQSISLAPRPTQ
jgi:hypothetical protein